jgi:site-specific DNA-cytosine methylase
LQQLPDGIIAGFPCVDLSIAGNMRGFSGHQSSLVREVFRIIDGCTELKFVFLENVDNIRAMPEFWKPLLAAFCERGFSARWVSLEGRNVGCQQRRRRWFLLAVRGSLAMFTLADPIGSSIFSGDDSRPDARLALFSEQSGPSFNPPGLPPPADWMLPKSSYHAVHDRLNLCGNAVIPRQARLAAQLLSTEWR